MSTSAYSFLPWLRRGIGGMISGTTALRASVEVRLDLTGEPIGAGPLAAEIRKSVELYGPGDITGIDARAIVRTEPRNWITNFEPNYLACIEFYDEDMPWRYSPAAPQAANLRLQPWLALVVLAESEFEERARGSGPLPAVQVADLGLLPPAADLWAWAHVHVNAPLDGNAAALVSSDMGQVLPRLQATLDGDPDLGYSRIVAARRLKPTTGYHAFLVPSFETGRLAGLGKPPTGVPSALTSAWESYAGRADANALPYYHRFQFRTGKAGDFEDLVRALKPRTVDPRVGLRDMDVQRPGSNVPGIVAADLNGILRLGGALQAPGSKDKLAWQQNEAWDDAGPHPFQTALSRYINLADDYQAKPAADAAAAAGGAGFSDVVSTGEPDDLVSPDPVITPPLYGRFHAAVDRLLTKPDGTPADNVGNWVHDLNLDPRFRVAASSGTRVIQKEQEDYMRAAWAQVGDVLEANRKIRLTKYATLVSTRWYDVRLVAASLDDQRLLRLSHPVHRRVVEAGRTLRASLGSSRITNALMSATATRALRPGGRLARQASIRRPFEFGALVSTLNVGKTVVVRPKTPPAGLFTVEEMIERDMRVQIRGPRFPRNQLENARLLTQLLGRRGTSLEEFDRLTRPGSMALVDPDNERATLTDPGKEDINRFVDASREWHDLLNASAKAAERAPPREIDIAGAGKRLRETLDPRLTLKKRLFATLEIPERISIELEESFDEIMAHPVIDTPMYKPLEAVSTEFILPNLNLIPPDSITMVETNQRFIEAYMVGLNHEFSRELLWREYPTDQRGTVFRQFWDVKGMVRPEGADAEAFRESLRDIPKIHMWKRKSRLGEHDNRERAGPQEEDVVLVIRGELLKKYPNTVIYAQRAKWQLKANGTPDTSKERVIEEIADAQFANPPANRIRLPLYEAKVNPDIYFFGFDLTADEARGGDPSTANPDPGWYIVLKERPGEPRFGFDTEASGPVHTFNDVAWTHVIPAGQASDFIDPNRGLPLAAGNLPADAGEKKLQRDDDLVVAGAAVSSARWAYILYQAPVMVAVHAAEMLKGL